MHHCLVTASVLWSAILKRSMWSHTASYLEARHWAHSSAKLQRNLLLCLHSCEVPCSKDGLGGEKCSTQGHTGIFFSLFLDLIITSRQLSAICMWLFSTIKQQNSWFHSGAPPPFSCKKSANQRNPLLKCFSGIKTFTYGSWWHAAWMEATEFKFASGTSRPRRSPCYVYCVGAC